MRRPTVVTESESVQAHSAASVQAGSMQSAEECSSRKYMHNDDEKEQGLSRFYSSANVALCFFR
jgi:hypothetical protein